MSALDPTAGSIKMEEIGPGIPDDSREFIRSVLVDHKKKRPR
jgi:hypothetical protein